MTGVDAHELLITQPRQKLHEQERAAVGSLDQFEQGAIGLCSHHVDCDLRDRRLVQRSQHDLLGPVSLEILECAL